MIILHAGGTERGLLLWGERSPEDGAQSSTSTGPKPKVIQPKPYPYDVGADGLFEALKKASSGFNPDMGNAKTIICWLPTRGRRPIPSSTLIDEPPRSRAKTQLAAWAVTAYPLSAKEAVEFLCRCMGKRTLTTGVVVGADLAYWADALRFAGSLVTRQQYLPDVKIDGNQYQATWEPVYAGTDADQVASLAKRMPGVARAIYESAEKSPPETSTTQLLKQFVTRSADIIVRSTVAGGARRTRPRGNSVFESVHDAWIHALKAEDNVIEGDNDELSQLALQVREWRRPVSVSADSPFRLCFRLEEPRGTEAPVKKSPKASIESTERWHVRYLLQPYDDPSLIIPVDDVWNAEDANGPPLGRNGSNAQEFALSSLGQAAGISSHIAASLQAPRPCGYSLDTTEAHQFLTEEAAALEQAGFGVMLPAWWTRKGTKARLVVQAKVKSPKMQGGGGISLETLVQFDWEVALGGTKLTVRELETLARMKAPLVQVRGQWVELDAAEIEEAVEFWKNNPVGNASVRDVVQMALGAKDGPGGFDLGGIKATGWIGKLLRQLDGRTEYAELQPPKAFSGTLRPYQMRGYSWLAFLRQWGLGACLADDMGLGKTVQTLALKQRDWEVGDRRPVLLICPTSVVNNWQKEAARFTPDLPVMVHHGPTRSKGTAFKEEAERNAIVITSYGLLHRDVKLLKEVPWAGVVLDEAQNIKNPETKQARAARSLGAEYRLALTGTPVENNVGDLWSILEFLNPGFLGTQADFKRNFFVPIQAGRDPDATERLKRITGPFILRRLKSDKSIISDLPDKQEMKVFCPLTKEQASLYSAVLKESEKEIASAEGIQRRGTILGMISKLKQVCNHPAQFLGDNSRIPGRSGKLTRLTEMLEEVIEVGDRALVFSQFAEMGHILKRHLQETFGREVLFLHGGVPKKQRDRMIERFQSDDEGPQVFILSLKAGGTGLNLTSANHVFHFDRWWNPAVENQATDRVFRIGQTRKVQIHKFICAGTLEETIDEMIDRKHAVAEQVVGAGEGWLTELSDEELREVFALRKEALRI